MLKRTRVLILILLVLAAATLSCRFGRSAKVELGETYSSNSGGFSFQVVPSYLINDMGTTINLTSPEAVSTAGPTILMLGGASDSGLDNDVLLEELKLENSNFVFQQGSKIKVDGIDGLKAEFNGVLFGESVNGKAVVVAQPDQEFIFMAYAPEDDWKDFNPIVEAVLESVILFAADPLLGDVDGPGGLFEMQVDDEEPAAAVEVIRQWAVYAEASSEYTEDDWSAMQATGAPDVDACGDDPRAWASRYADTEDYLLLKFEIPVIPTEIVIHQTYNPSQVVEILLEDLDGQAWVLWEGEPEQVNCPDVWSHTIELYEEFFTDTVVLIINQSLNDWGWAEIDAVELIGYPIGAVTAQGDSPVEPEPVDQPEQPQRPVGDIPDNYEGLMAGPVYQGWVSIVIGETMEADLDRIMTIEGRKSTDSWKPRESHKQTYLYEMPWDDMTGFISVTSDGWVYKFTVSANTHPTDFALATVNRDTYEELKVIYDRDKVIPYSVMANMLGSPGFLRETYVREDDGKIYTNYNWYNAAGDRITGIFYDGMLTGIIALNYIEAP